MPARSAYDTVIVGGGHNGLVAAAYLAGAGRSVIVLERLGTAGGAAVSTRPFAGVDARLSRYSYLVSLLPDRIVDDLGLRFTVRKRPVSSYTPDGTGGLLVGDEERTAESFERLTGGAREHTAWRAFQGRLAEAARSVFPTLTQPLPTRSELRERVGDATTWRLLFEEPIGLGVEEYFQHDLVRGMVLTDALIGTFVRAHDPSLRQNRCFLYHVIGGGTGDWNVPVGGMGALTSGLADAARAAGAEIATGHEATRVETDGTRAEVAYRAAADEGTLAARHVLVNTSRQELATLLDEVPPAPAEGAQLKINMLLERLPALRDPTVEPHEAFAGTFHIAEGYDALERAYAQAAAGTPPKAPPSEVYCHTLTDPSILGPGLAERGWHTLTLFGLHTPARLFRGANDRVRDALAEAALDQLDARLGESVRDCLARDAEGRPCIEVRSPLDLERDLRLPGGHIFHGDLAFPYLEDGAHPDGAAGGTDAAHRWGVATGHPNVLLCGAGAVRGGGVSGIGGHNAAMAVLGR
ncbi:phytoene desaturase family protein [Streptomyces sp. NPDC050560]|uniref:phytoene desaturase family protein n=1 Tax=Streptomyces sp. NPDC050560 TaxID=3365630 RepID=UPI00379EE3C2